MPTDKGKGMACTSSVTVANTRATGRMADTMAMAFARGRTGDAIAVNGAMEWPMATAEKPTPTERYDTMVNGSTMNQFVSG